MPATVLVPATSTVVVSALRSNVASTEARGDIHWVIQMLLIVGKARLHAHSPGGDSGAPGNDGRIAIVRRARNAPDYWNEQASGGLR